MKHDLTELARRFAGALDGENYDVVRALLAPDCYYEAPAGPIVGADAVVDSYRSAARIAATLFDRVQYESALLQSTPEMVEISFADRLTKDERHHIYCCSQRLYFSSGGLVARIIHRELPGESERLLKFCADSGVDLKDVSPP